MFKKIREIINKWSDWLTQYSIDETHETLSVTDKLREEVGRWDEWSIAAEKDNDGWESYYCDWNKIFKLAAEVMMLDDLSDADLLLLEKCWAISEEDIEMVEMCENRVFLVRNNLYRLAESKDPKVRWQVYEALKGGSNEDELVIRRGLGDIDSYCKRRAILALAHRSPPDAKEIATEFMDDDDKYMRMAAEALYSSRE